MCFKFFSPVLQCCYGSNGSLVIGQPGGGSIDRISPLVNFNEHNMDDLLPYAYCCRGGRLCAQYDELRPSRLAQAPIYEFPVPSFGGRYDCGQALG